jgi:twitching motility protein PilT
MSAMTFNEMLEKFVAKGASDIHLHVAMPPLARINGQLLPVSENRLAPRVTETLVESMCNTRQQAIFAEKNQVDLAYSVSGLGRFRVNLFRQRGSVSAVLRVVNSDEAQLQVVNLSQQLLEHFRDQEKGLILVTGPTGSGKSTTLARIIDEINKMHSKMIITVEDPIEYLHHSKKSAIVQREIGQDAPSFSEALVAAMRQDPEVIMIGEIRDYATATAALSAAQTGHLVFSTLHTLDTVRTVNRMLELFPPHERETARFLFADSLVGIVSQRLLPRKGGKGRIAALEVLKGTLRIKDLIRDETRTGELYDAIKDSSLDGMQLFDDALAELYEHDLIDYLTGFTAATSSQSYKLAATQIDLQRGRQTPSTGLTQFE